MRCQFYLLELWINICVVCNLYLVLWKSKMLLRHHMFKRNCFLKPICFDNDQQFSLSDIIFQVKRKLCLYGFFFFYIYCLLLSLKRICSVLPLGKWNGTREEESEKKEGSKHGRKGKEGRGERREIWWQVSISVNKWDLGDHVTPTFSATGGW